MSLSRITNWFHLAKQYFFTYKDGFFNLSYLSNSPELIVKSSIKMPFMGHDSKKQILKFKTPFLEGTCHYADLEEGLWLLHTNAFYKNKVSFSPIYDNELPTNYYAISVSLIENSFRDNYFESNQIRIKNQSISFIKPKGDVLHCHFKGAKLNQFVFYLSDDWVKKNIIKSVHVTATVKKIFTDPDNSFVNFEYDNKLFDKILNNISATLSSSPSPNFIELKKLTYEFITVFNSNIKYVKSYTCDAFNLSATIKLKNIEEYLLLHVHDKFPGIDVLSQKFNISPTKLKKDFKASYDRTLLQFFQEKQMELAHQYLKQGKKVKEVAATFKYQNVSKFSKTFQNHYSFLPSSTIK